MHTENQILKIADDYVSEIRQSTGIDVVIIHQSTIKKPYGSIFFYTSKMYWETGAIKYAVAGNAPFLVENLTGNIIDFGTSQETEYYIDEYEAGRWPDNRRLL